MDKSHLGALRAAEFLLPLAKMHQAQDSTENERAYLYKMAKWAVREFDPFFLDLNVSQAATLATSKLEINLRSTPWRQKHKIAMLGQKAFHYEHIIEVAALAKEVVASDDLDQIATVLSGIKVAWITMDEHASLKREDIKRRKSGGATLRNRMSWEETCGKAGIRFQFEW